LIPVAGQRVERLNRVFLAALAMATLWFGSVMAEPTEVEQRFRELAPERSNLERRFYRSERA
jgi:hypothetical protein